MPPYTEIASSSQYEDEVVRVAAVENGTFGTIDLNCALIADGGSARFTSAIPLYAERQLLLLLAGRAGVLDDVTVALASGNA